MDFHPGSMKLSDLMAARNNICSCGNPDVSHRLVDEKGCCDICGEIGAVEEIGDRRFCSECVEQVIGHING